MENLFLAIKMGLFLALELLTVAMFLGVLALALRKVVLDSLRKSRSRRAEGIRSRSVRHTVH